jgi:hypothetical protein
MISAVIEAATGASLLILPTFTASSLLGVPLDTPQGLVAGRIAGAALGALAIACWNARNGKREGLATGVVGAMLFYNFAAVVVLVYAGIRLGLRGPLLWPTIVLHFALALLCLVSARSTQRNLLTAETTLH